MRRQQTVLPIDDDRDGTVGASFRREAAGYRVLLAYDERKVIRMAADRRPDGFVLDSHAPPADDSTTSPWLRRREEATDTARKQSSRNRRMNARIDEGHTNLDNRKATPRQPHSRAGVALFGRKSHVR